MGKQEKNINDLDIRVIKNRDIPDSDRKLIHELFEASYENPNHFYLDKSMDLLGYIALAFYNQTLACFAVGDVIETDIPGISKPQIVQLGGISCIDPEFRRMGLFGYLQGLVANKTGLIKKDSTVLVCGRMAHPVTTRVLANLPGAIPKTGVTLSNLHKDVGLRIAELYKTKLDPDTFVVKGNGTPVGFPSMEISVTHDEWELFNGVDRNNGDSLLCMGWYPDKPEGW